MKASVRKMTVMALLTAMALLLHVVDSLLPPPVPVPGIRLGLANIITLISLKRLRFRDSALILLSRLLLSACFGGAAIGFLYSLSGGVLCLLCMWLVNLALQGKYLPVTSIMGALSHNIAQLFVAFAITSVPGIAAYLPFLMISGIVTGFFTGLCAFFTLQKLPGKFFQ